MSLVWRGRALEARVDRDAEGLRVARSGRESRFRSRPAGPGAFLLDDGGGHELVHVARSRAGTWVHARGRTWLLEAGARPGAAATAGSGIAVAPMTGKVVELRVQVGDVVAADQALLVLSAMKMQIEITAGVAGTVTAVKAVAGQQVEGGSVLVVVEAAP